jgi:hypothetical protein
MGILDVDSFIKMQPFYVTFSVKLYENGKKHYLCANI